MIKYKHEIDLILVNPGNRAQSYQSLGSTLSAIEPPVWAGLMATFVRNHGFSVAILDANSENLTFDETAKRIEERKPLLTAIVVYGHNPSASTQNMPAVREFCTILKNLNPEGNILLVGGHIAALPVRTLREEDADFTCAGEGPVTIVELLQALKTREANLSKVHDLCYRDGEAIITSHPAPLVQNLDSEMAGLAWDLLPMEKYRAHNWHCFGDLQRQPYAALYTSLGCPFHCNFCCIQAPFKSGERALGFKQGVNSYRLWSPEVVLSQIDLLVNRYGIRNIKFADELFVLNPKHVHDICDGIVERGYRLNIWAYARVDTMKNPDTLLKLKAAGVNWLALGIEAASERVRYDVRKVYGKGEVQNVVAAIKAAGINVIGNYIFGLPEDDLETMQATLDLALDLNCEFANFYCAMAYPGSKLYEKALENDWPLPEKWSGYSQLAVDTQPLPTNYLSWVEVLRFRDEAFQAYFNLPAYLQMIAQKFGAATANHIKEMASHKIARRLI
jgi:radical SAM superfamily enzyme YgiQ (UPF0313 family)